MNLPEAVDIGANDELNPDGFPWGIDLSSLTSVLCKAIQEQQGQINNLKAELNELSE